VIRCLPSLVLVLASVGGNALQVTRVT